MISSLRLLTGLSLVACCWSLDAVDLSIRLTDVKTNESPISLLFEGKETKVTVEGISSWIGQNPSDDVVTTFFNFTTYLGDEEVANGMVQLTDDGLEQDTDSFDAGVFVMRQSGSNLLRVVLMDAGLATTEVQMEVRAYQAWMVSIPFLVSLLLFFVLKAQLIQSLFASILIGSIIAHGNIVQGFRAVFQTYLLNAATRSEHVSL